MKIRATKPTISRLERELDAFLFDRAKGSKVAQTIQKGYVFCEPNDLEEVKKLIPNIQKSRAPSSCSTRTRRLADSAF